MKTAVYKAVANVGGVTQMARRLTAHGKPTSRQQVYRWMKSGKIRAEWVVPVASVSGVSVFKLRPDLYPHDVVR